MEDKEKLEKFCLHLKNHIDYPDVDSVDAHRLLTQVEGMIDNIVSYIQEQIEDM